MGKENRQVEVKIKVPQMEVEDLATIPKDKVIQGGMPQCEKSQKIFRNPIQ